MRLKPFRLLRSGPLVGALYLLTWLLLWPTAQPYWMLPYGVRFGALLLLPMRQWGWILGAELLASAGMSLHEGLPMGWSGYLLGELPEPLVTAAGLWLLRRFNPHAGSSLHNPQETTRLLLAAILVVLCTSTVGVGLLTMVHTLAAEDALIHLLGNELLGGYLGVLLVVPVMILLLRAPPSRQAVAGLLLDGLQVMLPAMAVLWLLSEKAASEPQFARALSLAPVLFFAFRHGWRGASLAMIVSSLGMTALDRQLGHPSSAAGYLFLAVAGTGTLMLGSATDALRRSKLRVAEQNTHLAAVNRRLDLLARQLRAAARGNLQADENQRRHLAAELHDELGQNITAIQTHVKLAQARLQQAGLEDIGTSINGILAHMRRALHRVLDDLRPAVLDEFGLLRAPDEGPIRDLLNTAGISYRTELRGDPRMLDDDTRTTIYRLAQESATNAVKHARAGEFRLRLRIGERRGSALALLDLRDDGIGLPERLPRGGHGLQGMRDRVTSLGGVFRLRPETQGVHLRVLLRSSIESPVTSRNI
ncbi:MAG: sensor histidine kinase [Rhodanobacter sp. 68-29]|nr:MASE1 domain-containing protein [Rhodanobacter sp.]ODV27928.1 MAG: histidine kinase [Rhodanobacter sp. SCN 68-63]OJY61423.1 MAG: sensor histidine kinase [Rhodanobacter sp. 68-29]